MKARHFSGKLPARNLLLPTPVYLPGRFVLDKYELVRPLAEGGMGTVWLARHVSLEVDVAVKLTFASEFDTHRQQRAFSEARLAAQLAHPGVCRVLDFGLTAEGDPCVVTELLQGETLETVLTLAGTLKGIEAVRILLPVLEALAAAHARGIVHQDVKPSNVFLARDSYERVQPKLLDFGIAREHHTQASWLCPGSISGTPFYMSPEQASGSDDIDARADVWSVCATLYELLSGQPPFDGETCESVLARVLEEEPRPLSAFVVLDETLSAIVARGLEKERKQRWASAAELWTALASWLIAQGVETDVTGQALRVRLEGRCGDTSASEMVPFLLKPRRRNWSRRVLVAAAGLVLLSTAVSELRSESSALPVVAAVAPLTEVPPRAAPMESPEPAPPAAPAPSPTAERTEASESNRAASRPRASLQRRASPSLPRRSNDLDYDFGF